MMPKNSLLAILTLISSTVLVAGLPITSSQPQIYHNGWIDFNKNDTMDVYEDPNQPIEKRVDDLLSRMNMEEKTCQLATLYGYRRILKDPLPTPEWKNEVWKDGIANIDEMHNAIGPSGINNPCVASPAATVKALNQVQQWFIEQTRLGIPVDFTNEGIRGVCYRNSTNFPTDLGLGATWDRDLISRIGQVVAVESKAIGYRNIYAPILDLARDPRWGRVLACYSEDPYLVSELGLRMANAIQQEKLASSPKHFAVYSVPKGGRDGEARTDPHVAPREMEMLYLRPWERLVREGHILGLMSSYNDYDGVPISGSHEFLIDRLRAQWGFQGYIVSDSEAVEYLYSKHHVAASKGEACAMFIAEGGNVHTNFSPPQNFIMPLRKMIQEGKLSMDIVDQRVRDVLRVKFLVGYFDQPYQDPDTAGAMIHSPAHQAVALQAARESIVLLKNENQILPLSRNLKRVLVCGPAAAMEETSQDRYGSSGGEVVSVLEGIQAAAEKMNIKVDYSEGCSVIDSRWPESELFPEPPTDDESRRMAEAVQKAADADVIVIVLGDSNKTIGECRSRTSLDLPGYQTDLAKALVKTGKPVVVVLMTGRPATINWIDRYVPGILQAWFPGEAGGTAVAEVLWGDTNPGGKLPVTFPRSVGQIPFNFPFKPASQAGQAKEENPNGVGYSRIEHGLYPFGYGLSYTTFEYSDLQISPEKLTADKTVTVSCTIKNTGQCKGDEVVQLYIRDVVSSVISYTKTLCGFERVTLQPGQSKTVRFQVFPWMLELINRNGQRVVEPGQFEVQIGEDSENILLKGTFDVIS